MSLFLLIALHIGILQHRFTTHQPQPMPRVPVYAMMGKEGTEMNELTKEQIETGKERI